MISVWDISARNELFGGLNDYLNDFGYNDDNEPEWKWPNEDDYSLVNTPGLGEYIYAKAPRPDESTTYIEDIYFLYWGYEDNVLPSSPHGATIYPGETKRKWYPEGVRWFWEIYARVGESWIILDSDSGTARAIEPHT